MLAASCSVMVMDTAPETKLRNIERLGATIVKATYDECWRTVEEHRSARMTGHFVHPFDDDDFISGNGTAGLEILEDLPDVDAAGRACSWRRRPARRASASRSRALRPEARVYAGGAGDRRAAGSILEAGGEPVPEWTPDVRRRRGRQVRPRDDVAAAARIRLRLDRRVARRGAAAMKLTAERADRRTCGCVRRRGRDLAGTWPRGVIQKPYAVVSGGNRRSRTAQLVCAHVLMTSPEFPAIPGSHQAAFPNSRWTCGGRGIRRRAKWFRRLYHPLSWQMRTTSS